MQQNAQPDPNLLMRNVNAAPVLPGFGSPSTVLQPNVVIVPGAKPELVDFTRPNHPTVDGKPVSVPPATPGPGTL